MEELSNGREVRAELQVWTGLVKVLERWCSKGSRIVPFYMDQRVFYLGTLPYTATWTL